MHMRQKKRKIFKGAKRHRWTGNQLALPAPSWCISRAWSLLELVRLMSTNPANLLRLPGGTLREGSLADIVLFDPNLEWTVDAQQLHSKSRNTSFDKMELTGRVVKTILGGKVVYEL